MEPRLTPLGGVDDAISEHGRAIVHEPFELVPRPVDRRPNERFVHPSQFNEDADVWRFVLQGEAFVQKGTSMTHEQLMDDVDRVFTGEQNPALPQVAYEWVEINGEPLNAIDIWEDDGGPPG
jgi:hypothetical protein